MPVRAVSSTRFWLAISTVVGLFLSSFTPTSGATTPNLTSPPVQSPGQLVPLVTDQVPLPLSDRFGPPNAEAFNQAGDFVFGGFGNGTAIFLRRASGGPLTRIFQYSEEVPGMPGSRTVQIASLFINSAGLVAFRSDTALSTGELQSVVMTSDGTTLRVIARGTEIAPGAGGARYERGLTVVGLNDASDILMLAGLVNSLAIGAPAKTTLFLVPAGQASQRLAGLGDVAPGTGGGTLASIQTVGFNNAREAVFVSQIAGGSGGQGVFVATTSGLRKIAATGDPAPGGGTFVLPIASRINNNGEVTFADGPSAFRNTVANGTSLVVTTGSVMPAAIGGTATGTTTVPVLNQNGDIAFVKSVAGSPTTATAILRSRPGAALDVVAYTGEPAPGGGALTITSSTVTMSDGGVVTFAASVGGVRGLFQQAPGGPVVEIARDGQATGTPLGGTFSLASAFTRTLSDGSVYILTDLVNSSATNAALRWQAGAMTVLMSTDDVLPPGANTVFNIFFTEAAGDYVGFPAERAGGRTSIAIHRISSRNTRIAATDGDASPTVGGGLLKLGLNVGPVYVNSAGSVVFSATVVGGSKPGTGIFLSPPGGGVQTVAGPGDADSSGHVLTTVAELSFTSVRPLNSAGQVVFRANFPGGSNSIFVGGAGATPVKVAAIGDPTSTGLPITSMSPASASAGPVLNDSGQVVFPAQTTGGFAGLFLAGTPHVKIARTGDVAPGGGTFTGFRQPSLNNHGEVAFAATVSGGPGSGIYLYTPGVGLSALALNGAPAPGGGVHSIPTVLASLRPDVILNNQHDALFVSDLTGGSSTAAYFIRRGVNGLVSPIVHQGDPAPGTTSVFEQLPHTINAIVGEFSPLSDTGDVAFFARFVENGRLISGTWHVRPDGSIEDVVVRGTVSPDFGGGSAALQSQKAAWASGGRLALRVLVGGGSFADSIMLFVPTSSNATPSGANVSVTPVDSVTNSSPVTIQFSNVAQAGETTLFTSPGAPTLPGAYAFGDPPVFFEISTTAVVSGPINICIDISGIAFPSSGPIRLLHFENGAWQDVTTSGPTGGVICGTVTSLSPFAVVQVIDTIAPSLSINVNPSVIWPPNGQLIEIVATIDVSDDLDPAPRVELVSITSNETLAGNDVSGAAFGTDDRSFQLRARRSGTSTSGRIYTITYRATDWLGHSTLARATVTVPHDR